MQKNLKIEKIYVKTKDIPVTKTRRELIDYFLQGNAFTTYSDKDCTELQCERGKYRSVSELYQIILARFPKTSFKATLGIIGSILRQRKNIVLVYCTQVNKVVVKYACNSSLKYVSNYSRDNHLNTKGVDGYSLKDYLEIINELN
jgi:hypothetical protein